MGSKVQVCVGDLKIGGDAPLTVQSMLSAASYDLEANLEQAKALQGAGCDIIRVAVPDKDSVRLIPALKEAVDMPVVGDIHFDYKLALEAVAAGVDKIRLNPGNIGGEEKVRAVAKVCREGKIPIRIGINAGSLEKHLLVKYGHPTPEALVESALDHARMLECWDFTDIVLSLKASSVPLMVKAYRLMSQMSSYPLHLGVTEAGTSRMGLVKSAVGIGSLLLDGIGDTLRVSLTAPPTEEVGAARDILKAIGMGKGVNVVSCPTCGRTRIDLVALANQVETALEDCALDITVAVMGCAVNGPGEAREADIGVAGGDGTGLIFVRGEVVEKVPQERIVEALLEQIELLRDSE